MTVQAPSVILGSFLVVSSVATLVGPGAAPPQDYPARPGDPTPAKVWVQNRTKAEAVPVNVEAFESAAPIAVQMSGSWTVQARLVRQAWDYRVVTVATGEDPAAAMATAGSEGWEATGIQTPAKAGGTAILLKRPR